MDCTKASNRIGGLVPRPRGRLGNHRGMALMVALLVLVVMSALGVAMLSLSQTEVQVGRSQSESLRALYLADAAVERARAELNRRLDSPTTCVGVACPQTAPKTSFNAELTTNGAYLYGSASTFVNFDSNGQTVGQYRLQVVNNNTGPDPDGGTATNDLDRSVYVIGTGRQTFLGHTVERRVEAFLSPSDLAAFSMGCGNPGEQTLEISGNPTIGGTQGSVHSNCNFSASGNYSLTEDLNAVGTITNTGSTWSVGGSLTPGADPRPIPAIVPTDYKNSTYMKVGDYVMTEATPSGPNPARAYIYEVTGFDGSGNPILGVGGTPGVPGAPAFIAAWGSSLGAWPSGSGGWEYSGTPGDGGTWQYSGSDVPLELANRAFYFEKAPGTVAGVKSGNVKIGSSPGSLATPWKMSIITDGHIDISGNPVVNPADSAKGVQLISGTDMKFGGTTVSNWAGGGIIAAHEQVDISGNPQFVGLFMVENAANTDPFVSQVSISGNPTITYSGAPTPPAAWNMGLLRVTWRELP